MAVQGNSEEFVFQIGLMFGEARSRLRDASVLNSTLSESSDSGYLLQLLGFELLLKAVLLINGKKPERGHRYGHEFQKLPSDVTVRLESTAIKRMTTAADYSQLPDLLETWGTNFIELRYPYEKYEGMSAGEYTAREESWIAGGAQADEADFTYHPNELYGLTYALEQEVEHWLKSEGVTAD